MDETLTSTIVISPVEHSFSIYRGLRKPGKEARALGAIFGFVSIIAIVLLVVGYMDFTPNSGTTVTQTSSITTSNSGIQGVVTGYVTVGPSQPVCSANQTCNVDLTGYSLVFTSQCHAGSYNCKASMAELAPSGHYSILLPSGNYTVTGLHPYCNWLGCPSAFPKTIVVEGGMQLVFNVEIDTGIR